MDAKDPDLTQQVAEFRLGGKVGDSCHMRLLEIIVLGTWQYHLGLKTEDNSEPKKFYFVGNAI